MFDKFATSRYRWVALAFIALGLAIVIIDNTVLNVAIPYILRDLRTDLPSLEWVISGYALLIATFLITMGRLGDIFGRKKIFLIGTVFFAVGSFIASISQSVQILFFGEALIEAIGAAMMLTSTLSLVASEFEGKERALAFGVWGSVAGASSALGPLLGGWLTAYHSWRWSLRINVFVALVAIAGSIFIKESKGEGFKKFDWWGTVLSGLGLFSLVFALIEGQKYGWIHPNQSFSIQGWSWPLTSLSPIPVFFAAAAIFLASFLIIEYLIEKRGGSPLLKLTMFKKAGFSLSLLTVGIISLGQLGLFFVFPIYTQNVLGFNAFQTGLIFIPASFTALFIGPLSGLAASKIGPKWIVSSGMFILAGAILLIRSVVGTTTTWLDLAPYLIFFGVGIGMSMAQLTNLVLSSVPNNLAGEASGANATMRQVGSSIGIAIIGAVLTTTLTTRLADNIRADSFIPDVAKERIISATSNTSTQFTSQAPINGIPAEIVSAVKADSNQALVDSSKEAIMIAFGFILLGAICSLLIPEQKDIHTVHRRSKQPLGKVNEDLV